MHNPTSTPGSSGSIHQFGGLFCLVFACDLYAYKARSQIIQDQKHGLLQEWAMWRNADRYHRYHELVVLVILTLDPQTAPPKVAPEAITFVYRHKLLSGYPLGSSCEARKENNIVESTSHFAFLWWSSILAALQTPGCVRFEPYQPPTKRA